MPTTLRNTDILFNDGTTQSTAASTGAFTNISYTGTLTGGTGVVNLGSGQLFKGTNGNVGIGTSTPVTNLEVKGSSPSINVNGTTSASFRGYSIRQNNTEIASMLAEASNGENRITAGFSGFGGFQTFYTNGLERVRLDSAGNLLVGTTSAGINNNIGTTIESSGLNNARITVNHSSAGSSNDSNFMQFGYEGNLIGRIVQATTSGVSYTTSSDYRLKHDIQPMTGALAKVALLKPCTYKWNMDDSADEGFIAHELAEVCPSAVSGEKDAVNEDGSIKPQGIDTSFLVATLTAALQELNAKFDAYVASHP